MAVCMCMVCPFTSVEKHILKIGARKMGNTVKIYRLVTPTERVPSEQQGIWQNHFEVETGDILGTARLPQEETGQVVSWAGESPLPSLVGGMGKTRSSAL